MKKPIIALAGLIISANIYADTGCMSLAKSRWNGQAKLITGQVVNINNVIIDSVESEGQGNFKVTGTLDGEAMEFNSTCFEEEAGKISTVTLGSESSSLMSFEFSPNDQNPSRLSHLFGQWKGEFIDSTNDTSKSYIQK